MGGLVGYDDESTAACFDQIAGYIPGSDVTEHNKIDLDHPDNALVLQSVFVTIIALGYGLIQVAIFRARRTNWKFLSWPVAVWPMRAASSPAWPWVPMG